jgi:hypothetical protein
MKRLLHLGYVLSLGAALSTSAPGCSKDKEAAAAEAVSAENAVTERNGDVEATWGITPDGQVTALVRDKDGLPVTSGISGSVTVRPQGGGAPVVVPLAAQGNGLVTAQIPKLSQDLTEVGYEVQAGSASATGTMHVPRGGTRELVESATEAAAAGYTSTDQKGPNGGVVQVVGDDLVEVVGDKNSGTVRMYFLDDDLKVIPIGKRRAKLAMVGASPAVIDVDPDPSGMYLTGKAAASVQPVKATVAVIDGDEVDVAICGYVPGGVVVIGPDVPVLGVFVVVGWAPVVVVQPGVVVMKGKGKGKGKGKHKWKW